MNESVRNSVMRSDPGVSGCRTASHCRSTFSVSTNKWTTNSKTSLSGDSGNDVNEDGRRSKWENGGVTTTRRDKNQGSAMPMNVGRRGQRRRGHMHRVCFPRCPWWIVVLVLICMSRDTEECPSSCECKWKSGKESVLCAKAGLRRIPEGLDPGTQVLNMTGNFLERLPTRVFLSQNLTNLQKIFLSDSSLGFVDRYAFAKLTNLVELDLSGNRLETVPSHSFPAIPELRELKLNLNPIDTLANDAFVSLPRLVRLELTACRLTTIETWAFRGLPALEWLRLDNNRLLTVQASSFFPLRSLHGLRVEGNPWNCSCALQPLREWMMKHNVPFGVPPICASPSRVSGRPWDRLAMEDFACLPSAVSKSEVDRVLRIVEGDNVTLQCRLQATPDTQIRWSASTKVTVANGSVSTGSIFVLTEAFVWEVEEGGWTTPNPADSASGKSLGLKSSQLTILQVTMKDAGAYVCRAESRAGVVSTNFSLIVLQKKTEQVSGRLMLTGGLLAGVGVLGACLLVICMVLGSRRRYVTSRVVTEEKMELNHVGTGQNGGGTVASMHHNHTNHVHTHSNNHSSNNLNGRRGGGGQGGGQQESHFGGGPVGPGGISGGGSIDSLRMAGGRDYKALPTMDPDDATHKLLRDLDYSVPISGSNGSGGGYSRGGGGGNNHPLMTSSPEGSLSPGTSTSGGGYLNNKTLSPASSGRDRTVFPDLIDENMSSMANDFASLPRANRNHDSRQQTSGSNYFHRRMNSESQSPLLPQSSEKLFTSGYSMMSNSSNESPYSSQYSAANRPLASQLNYPVLSISSQDQSAAYNSGNNSMSGLPPVPQRMSMPTSPAHDNQSLMMMTAPSTSQPRTNAGGTLALRGTDPHYHSTQLASFLHEYRLLQKELLRMSSHLQNGQSSAAAVAAAAAAAAAGAQGFQNPAENDNEGRHGPAVPGAQAMAMAMGLPSAMNMSSNNISIEQQRALDFQQQGNSNNVQHHQQQLKSILKNPNNSNNHNNHNNNYMA